MTCAACSKRGQTWNGSAPVCAFDDWEGNWNCATLNAIRDITYEGQPRPDVDYRYCDDMKYATVCIDHIELATGSAMALWVAWYKSRGSTDALWLLCSHGPPRRPTEDDLRDICESFGAEL